MSVDSWWLLVAPGGSWWLLVAPGGSWLLLVGPSVPGGSLVVSDNWDTWSLTCGI